MEKISVNERVRTLANLNINEVVKQDRKGKVEANVRSIIIEELLACLGWDKLKGDLDFEHSVQNKFADVALMIRKPSGERIPKVIIECKDLDVNLDKFIDQAFEYALTKQVKWIILTNGREIRLYSTFIENVPDRRDHLLVAPPIFLNELENRFDELKKWISKKSIINKQLDRYSIKRELEIRKKVNYNNLNEIFIKLTPILKVFFQKKILQLVKQNPRIKNKIISWLYFKGINFKDKDLWSEIYAKEAAFVLLNRILFLRIGEDRQFFAKRLTKEGLKAWGLTHQNWTYNELLNDSFKEIEKIDYDSIYKENIFDIIEIKEKLLKEIIEKFSEINFADIDSDIFGKTYQEHIKENERKTLGQYYTPEYIIRFIINSIDYFLKLNEILPTTEFKVLDPACGSGGFLIEIYNLLKNKMVQSKWDEKILHEAILTKFIYGIDIEPFAAQFASINLLIKNVNCPVNYIFIIRHNTLLSGGSNQTRVVPIKVKKVIAKDSNGNGSIIAKEFPFKNYNIVVGNPPYFLISKQEGSKSSGKKFHTTYLPKSIIKDYKNNYKSWPHNNKNPNIFYLFIERGIELLKDGGYLGYIIPDILLAGESTSNLRKFILDTCKVVKIFIIEGRVFERGGVSNIIIILQKCKDLKLREKNKIEIIKTSIYELKANDSNGNYNKFIYKPYSIKQKMFYSNPFRVFSVRMTKETGSIFLSIYKKLKQGELIKLGKILHIHRGIENLSKKDALDRITSTKKTIRKLIAGDNIEKYRINWEAPSFNHRFVDYDIKKYDKINFKNESWFTQPKILLKRVSNKLVAALESKKEKKHDYYYTLDSVQMIWLKNNYKENYDLRVILAILNSKFMNFYYTTLFSYKKLFSRVQKVFLQELPIPKEIDPNIQTEICNLVEELEKDNNNYKINRKLNQIISLLYFTEREFNSYAQHLKPKYSLLDIPGLGIKYLYKLNLIGIVTIEDLIDSAIDEVAEEIEGIGSTSIKKWIEEGKKLLEQK